MAASPGRTWTWRSLADAVGHCILVFAFVPALAALPRWLLFEAANPLDRRDAVVLAFLPVRGALVVLGAFAAGAAPGVIAGALAGVLLSAWPVSAGTPGARSRWLLRGALSGLAASAAMVLAVAARGAALPGAAVAFELGSGLVCGAIAAPGVRRLASRDQRRAGSSSAFQT